MKKLIVMFVLLTVGLMAQNTWTTNYGLTRIAAGTLGWADTLNHNWTLTDGIVKAHQDTIDAVKADLYTQHNYDGTHKSAVLTLSNFTSVEQAKIVQTTGVQMINGTKYFYDGIFASSLFALQTVASTNSGSMWFTPSTYAELLFRNSTAVDTIPDKAWVRANTTPSTAVVTLTGTQTITGDKTFSGTTTLSGNVVASDSVGVTGNLSAQGGWFLKRSNVTYDSIATPGYIAGTGLQNIYLTATVASSIEIINGTLYDGQQLVIINAGTNVVTMLDGGINMHLAGNFAMGQYDAITLLYNSTLGKWIELSRSNN